MTTILGINLSELKSRVLMKKIEYFLDDQGQHYLVTPNPEIVLQAQEDEEFFYILNKADLAIVDGFGLKMAAWFYGINIPRITGADLTQELLKIANNRKLKVLILNWRNGLSKKTSIESALNKKFTDLKLKVLDISRNKFLNLESINKINSFSPVLMFCTLGFPYQEKLIYHNLHKLPSLKLAIGVGGSIDFIIDKVVRAPKIIRILGIEWLWRLIKQPKRFKRIYNATLVFIAKFLYTELINRWRYRPNVVCILYKNEGQQKKFLIVKRADSKEHWQLPQGGRDGENIAQAGERELQEELGIAKEDFISRGTFNNVYHYKFNKPSLHKNSKAKLGAYRHQGYKGQRQSLYIAEYLGVDSKIKINFWDHNDWQWITMDRLIDKIHPIRQTGAKIFLEKFKSLKL